MRWETKKTVLKHYQMLTSTQANIRQAAFSLLLASSAASLHYVSHTAFQFASLAAAAFLTYSCCERLITKKLIRSISGHAETPKNQTEETPPQPQQGTPGKKDKKETPQPATEQAANPQTANHSQTPAQPIQPETPDKQEADTHTFEEDPPPPIPTYWRILQSSEVIFTARMLLTVSIIIPLAKVETQSLPTWFAMSISFLTAFASTYLLLNVTLRLIEAMEIDEFPDSKSEQFLQHLYKTFSPAKDYYFLGEVDGRKIGLPRMSRFLHSLIGAPTGEGKSSSLIIPPLLIDANSRGSAVVPDAKSPELYNWVAGRWLDAGKRVYLFDPWHPDTISINFLLNADDHDLLTAVDVLMREREEAIAKEEAFFKARTRYLLFAMFKLVQTFKPQYCNLGTVYNIVQSIKVLEKFIDSAEPDIKELFADFHALTSETRVNAVTSIKEKLDVFMDDSVRKSFSLPEFKLDMLFKENEPCLLVLGAPIDKKEPGTKIASLIVNLIINMAFRERRMMKQAIQRGERAMVPNDLYLYLDELRNLKITALADLVSIARETRTHVIGSVTDLGFLKYYKEDESSLLGNFRTRIFMRGLDLMSAKYVSDSLGKYNAASYRLFKGLMVSMEEKNLLNADRVINLPEHKIIVFSHKTQPFVADAVSIYRTKWLKKMVKAPPAKIREIYEKWGLVKGDLQDIPLPMIKTEYDMKEIKGTHSVNTKTYVTPEYIMRNNIGVDRTPFPTEFAQRAPTVEEPPAPAHGAMTREEEMLMSDFSDT